MIIRKRREWSTEYLANNEKGTIEHFAQSRQGQICLQTTVAPFHFLSMKILDLTIPLNLQSCGVYEPTINEKLKIFRVRDRVLTYPGTAAEARIAEAMVTSGAVK